MHTLEVAYRYLAPSRLAGTGLRLSTTGGRASHPYFFRGFVENTPQLARAMLTVSEVARTRYFDLEATNYRDPVVTSNISVLRFEAFSACNDVYVRYDLDQDGFDADHVDWGSTNIDINEPLRDALSGLSGPGTDLSNRWCRRRNG